MTGNLTEAPLEGRVRSLSDGGLELVMPQRALPAEDVSIAIDKEGGQVRHARVIWRKLGRFGLAFTPGDRPSRDAQRGPLSRMLRRKG